MSNAEQRDENGIIGIGAGAPSASHSSNNQNQQQRHESSLVDLHLVEDENGENNEREDDDYWTASELLKELTRTYLNESLAPRILSEKLDLVDKMLAQMGDFERIMARNPNKRSVTYSAHRMELCRIEHLVNSYLRARLRKLERNPAQILQEHSERLRRAMAAFRAGKALEEQAELLDTRELRFVQQLHRANGALFADSFLKKLPASLQWLPVSLDSSGDRTRVFIEVLAEGLEDVPVPNMADPNSEMLLPLAKGSRHLVPFNCIQELLESGQVCLL